MAEDDREPSASTEIGEYKGNKVITIYGGYRPFSFGVKKAELILEVLDDLRKFVAENQEKEEDKDKAKDKAAE